MYALLLWSIPMGILAAFRPDLAEAVARGMTAYLRGIPEETIEAAVIDGLSYFGIYRSITLPLSKPALVSVAILASIARWGEFLWPLLVTRVSTYRPLTVAMQQLFSIDPTYWGDIFAFASMMTLPLLIIFVIFQKHFVESIARTGIKG